MRLEGIKYYGLGMTFFLLTSCEYTYTYDYVVQNNTDDQIKVALVTESVPVLDTTYIIESQQSLQIYETDHGVEGSNGPYFDDVRKDLINIRIIKNDTLVSNRDYRENSNWEYIEGNYSTIVTDVEFE